MEWKLAQATAYLENYVANNESTVVVHRYKKLVLFWLNSYPKNDYYKSD